MKAPKEIEAAAPEEEEAAAPEEEEAWTAAPSEFPEFKVSDERSEQAPPDIDDEEFKEVQEKTVAIMAARKDELAMMAARKDEEAMKAPKEETAAPPASKEAKCKQLIAEESITNSTCQAATRKSLLARGLCLFDLSITLHANQATTATQQRMEVRSLLPFTQLANPQLPHMHPYMCRQL
jgi:hypothetical protein